MSQVNSSERGDIQDLLGEFLLHSAPISIARHRVRQDVEVYTEFKLELQIMQRQCRTQN